MYRRLLKISVLALYIGCIGLMVYRNDMRGGIVAAIVMLLIGLVSFNKKEAIDGDDQMPGLLPIATILFLIGPVTFFHMLPALFHGYGISDRVPDNSFVALLSTGLASAFMALGVWVPYVAYSVIDKMFDRFAKK
jgi:hypothetical protein